MEIKCQLDATDDIYCRFYCLLNMFRAPLCPSSGAREYYTYGRCLWYLVLWFSSCRYGVELRVMCPVCRLLQIPHVSGTITPIIRSSRELYRWSLPMVFGALVFKLSVWCGAEGYVSGLQAAPNTTCFRHHYAHHQELESIIQMVAAYGIWSFGFQVVGMVWS